MRAMQKKDNENAGVVDVRGLECGWVQSYVGCLEINK